MGGERRELWSPLTVLQVTSVLVVPETGWELTAARKRLSTPVLLALLVFPLVILKVGDRSEPNVPCTDVSIDFKLCKFYCLKIFVKWLNWTFSKGALSISKLTTFKCIFCYCSSILSARVGRSVLYGVFSSGGLSEAGNPACLSVLKTSQRNCAPRYLCVPCSKMGLIFS